MAENEKYDDNVIDVVIQDEIEFMKSLCNLSEDELLKEFNFEKFIGCENIGRLFNVSMLLGCIVVEIGQYPKEDNGYIQVAGYTPYIQYSIEETREVIENMAENFCTEEEALRDFYQFLNEEDEAKKKYPTFDEYKKNENVITAIDEPSNNERLYKWGEYYIWYSGDNPRRYTLIMNKWKAMELIIESTRGKEFTIEEIKEILDNKVTEKNFYGAVNQFLISGEDFTLFQSYRSPIAMIRADGQVYIFSNWDYSKTTGKYRNMFLNETKKDTLAKIKSGEYIFISEK